jgi:heavy metal sensor kinase
MYLLRRRLLLILFSIPPLVAGAGMVGRVSVAQLMKPISQVTTTAQRITDENLDQRVPVEHSDEDMHHLVHAFNEMIERLSRSFAYIKEFSMQVAHELKTPLTIIKGETDLALRQERKGDEYRRVLMELRAETDRMTNIINDLLLSTRLEYARESFPLEPTDLTLILEELSEHTKLLAENKNISYNLELPVRPIMVNAYPLHLRRLFLNLISNALNFTEEGGTVCIQAWKDKGSALVSVLDTGAGIPDADLPRIFDRFFRKDQQGKTNEPGTGLGLSIARSIAQLHRGSIQVQSKENQGSIFTVNIPLADHPT